MVCYTVSDLKAIEWIAKSSFVSSLDDDDDDSCIEVPNHISLIPDVLTNEKLIDILDAMMFFSYTEVPSNFYDYVRGLPINEFDVVNVQNSHLLKEMKTLREFRTTKEKDLCIWAARNGELEILKWARKNNYPCNDHVLEHAVIGDQLDILIYLSKNGFKLDKYLTGIAAWNGHLRIIIYFIENGHHISDYTCGEATQRGHLDCLIYAYEHGCPLLSSADRAYLHKQMDCFMYAIENKGSIRTLTVEKIIENGDLETLKYIHIKGHTLDRYLSFQAVEKNQLSCFIYLCENNCYNLGADIEAAKRDYLDFLVYLSENDYGLSTQAAVEAANRGFLRCLMCINQNDEFLQFRSDHVENRVLLATLKNMQYDCFKYCIESGYRLSPINRRIARGGSELKEYLDSVKL